MKQKMVKTILSITVSFTLIIAISCKAHAQASEPFIGQLAYVAFDFAPRNWSTCDGQLLTIGQNATLFSLLGTRFGGDGRTNFKLPDMRGRVPIHMGQGPGLSTYILGFSGGFETITLSTAHMPTHTHGATAQSSSTSTVAGSAGGAKLRASSADSDANDAQNNSLASRTGKANKSYTTSAPDVDMHPDSVTVDMSGISVTTTTDTVVSVQNNGGGQGFPVVQPYTVLNCIIALDGIYPQRN